MRILSELIGGIVLILVFAYGVERVVEYLTSNREKTNGDNVSVPGPSDTTPPKPD